jgi:uncharacterized protein
MLGYVLRALLVLFLLRMLSRFVGGLFRGLADTPRREGEGARSAPERGVALVRDPVCNTFVPRDRALRALIDGEEHHFCSEACRTKALAR